MPEEFEDRDLSDSVFWGVNLQRATFRDADLTGSTFFHVFMKNMSIDGEIDRLVINGVDVTDYVNRNDRWWPLRNNLSPDSVEVLRESWSTISAEWATLLEKVSTVEPSVAMTSVNGEWSLRDTLRHLLFAVDKWFVIPVLGETNFAPIGLPNTGSQGREWPGLDMTSDPDLATVLAARSAQHARFTEFISTMSLESLPETVQVPENGTVPAFMCFHVVLEEEFEHLRYMIRDLATLGID
jgi:hypothetical protein